MMAQLVIDAQILALWRRGRSDALQNYPHQGSQYESLWFQQLLAEHCITCHSMPAVLRLGQIGVVELLFFVQERTSKSSRVLHP
jgi:putative transposase